ncbi:MAG: hypothetical protein JW944_07075 [Deltaproteobacteria bacterium]|nr:hypothetical protein [Deltaproteobacteria bacterium]
MEDKEIYMLFSGLAEDADQDNGPLKEVFRVLIKSTLRYRDTILKKKGVTVTVQDVRSALDWLVPAIKTGRLPATDNRISLDLLKIWLDELKVII